MKLYTKSFLLLALTIFTISNFTSCKRDSSNNNNNTTEKLEFDLTEARPYQPISAVYKGGALRNQSYTGTIGSSEIVLGIAEGDNSNSVLVGLIPENVSVGAKVISIDIDGTTYTHNITILQNETVANPDALFDDFLATYTAAEYAQYFDDMADFQAAINELKALPEADKQIAAQILANNKVAVDALAQSIRNAELNAGVNFGKNSSGCDAPCKIGAVAAVLGTVLSSPALATVGTGIIVALVLKRIVIPVIKALINKAIEGIKFALSLGYDRMATIAEMVYDTFLKEISNKTLALPDTIVLERGEPLKLSLKTIREPLIQESNRSQYAFVNSFLDLYNQVKAKLVPLQLALPAINEGQEVRDYATSLDGFAINVQGNSNVTVSPITGTPQQARVTFNATQSGPQPFTFTYSYKNERNETTSFTQRAKFKVVPFELKGFWKLIYYTDTTRTTIGEVTLIDFQNGAEDLGLPISITSYPSGNVSDQTGSPDTWNQSFDVNANQINLTNNYWSTILYKFDFNSSNPNYLIGYSVGLSYDGYVIALEKQ